ncbi:DUF4240 domain-containing protein [Nonomuraea sp. NPDC049141]|uniref:DUF4240 domain-containing protein n=1 Tax=Nonomuraea sp. NPDC049141 TaxID=3155500 RepID=UPI0033E5524E
MDVDSFWAMIERSAQETCTRAERLAWLRERLSALPVAEIVDYETWWTIAANRGCSWDMYAVYWTLMGSGSSDGFEYFVSWLISLGREAFETVADCPDAAIDLPQVQHVLELERSFFRGCRRVTWSKDGKFRLTRLTRRRRDVRTGEERPEFELMGYVTYEPYRKATGLEADSLGDAAQSGSGTTRSRPNSSPRMNLAPRRLGLADAHPWAIDGTGGEADRPCARSSTR